MPIELRLEVVSEVEDVTLPNEAWRYRIARREGVATLLHLLPKASAYRLSPLIAAARPPPQQSLDFAS